MPDYTLDLYNHFSGKKIVFDFFGLRYILSDCGSYLYNNVSSSECFFVRNKEEKEKEEKEEGSGLDGEGSSMEFISIRLTTAYATVHGDLPRVDLRSRPTE